MRCSLSVRDSPALPTGHLLCCAVLPIGPSSRNTLNIFDVCHVFKRISIYQNKIRPLANFYGSKSVLTYHRFDNFGSVDSPCRDGFIGCKSILYQYAQRIEGRYGRVNRVWLMDRGIPTKETLAQVRSQGTFYLVGTPAGLTARSVIETFSQMQMIDAHLPTTDGRVILLQRYTEPEPEVQLLLDRLNSRLPSQPPPRIYDKGALEM